MVDEYKLYEEMDERVNDGLLAAMQHMLAKKRAADHVVTEFCAEDGRLLRVFGPFAGQAAAEEFGRNRHGQLEQDRFRSGQYVGSNGATVYTVTELERPRE
jgi:hypothetical protein